MILFVELIVGGVRLVDLDIMALSIICSFLAFTGRLPAQRSQP